jgi:hypothetical protein
MIKHITTGSIRCKKYERNETDVTLRAALL